MASSFNVRNADGYEQLMGRWSRRLAPPFIDFAGVADGERVLDVGCGTGSLTFALAAGGGARRRGDRLSRRSSSRRRSRATPIRGSRSSRATPARCPTPTPFDRALSLLVLHFVPEAGKAVAEMRRVVRPGGVVAAAVGTTRRNARHAHVLWIRSRRWLRRTPAARPLLLPADDAAGRDARSLHRAGLGRRRGDRLLIRMDYAIFDDYWAPIAAGEGPSANTSRRSTRRGGQVERGGAAAYEAGEPDGPRSFAAIAWACRGVVPDSGVTRCRLA